jgi:hypothetical protein
VQEACKQTSMPLRLLIRQYGVQTLKRQWPDGRREHALLVPSELFAVASSAAGGAYRGDLSVE